MSFRLFGRKISQPQKCMLIALIAKSAEEGWKMVLETIVDVRTEINESVKNLILFAEDMGAIYHRCLIGPHNGRNLMILRTVINKTYSPFK